MTVNEMAKALMDGATAGRDEPDIQADDGQGEARESDKVTQHGTFQIEAMFFQIAMHFFGPHSAPIIAQGHFAVGQVGGQAPGFVFAGLPMHQQVGWVDCFGSQVAAS